VANRDPNGNLTSHGKFCCLIDFTGYTMANTLSLRQGLEVIMMMQNHYPERLACFVFVDPPWIFQTLYDGVAPFSDEETVKKVLFVPEQGEARSRKLSSLFNVETLETIFGGQKSVPFDSRIYIETTLDGTEFGLEFDEQLAMHKMQDPELIELHPGHSVCGDPVILHVPREECNKV